MGIIFTESGKCMDFSVIKYEFDYTPNELSDKGKSFDANWLTVKVVYSESGNTYTYKDNCLLACELLSLTEDIDDIISGKETGLITDFIEPNLKFAFTMAGEICAVQIRFIYDMSDGEWKEIYISQSMTINELHEMNEKMKEFSRLFPER